MLLTKLVFHFLTGILSLCFKHDFAQQNQTNQMNHQMNQINQMNMFNPLFSLQNKQNTLGQQDPYAHMSAQGLMTAALLGGTMGRFTNGA